MMKFSSLFFSLGFAALVPASAGAAGDLTRCPAPAGLSDAQRALIHRSNGVYSLHEAVAAGDARALGERLREGANPNQLDEFGNTPLLLAARCSSLQVAEMLLAAGADVLARDAGGRTPGQLCSGDAMRRLLAAAEATRRSELELEASVLRGDVPAVRAALAAGVNPNARSADADGFLLFSAVAAGKVAVLQTLLEAGANANAVSPRGNISALHLAARGGDAEAIRSLLAAGANPMLRSSNSAYALHEAVWNRQLGAVKALLPAYAAVNFSPDGAHNNFPINMAMSRGGLPFVQAFLEAGLDPNAPCLRKDPPLIRAARDGRADIVRLLLSYGADKGMQDAAGKSAADYAAPAVLPLLH